jgi:hypothetical protein
LAYFLNPIRNRTLSYAARNLGNKASVINTLPSPYSRAETGTESVTENVLETRYKEEEKTTNKLVQR